MGERTLKEIALCNYKSAINQMKLYQFDEGAINLVGYLLQQSAEIFIKYHIEMSGNNFPRVHKMSDLINLCYEQQVPIILPERFVLFADTLTVWETQTRYVKDFLLSLREIKLAIGVVKELFTSNGITEDDLLPKVSQLHIF